MTGRYLRWRFVVDKRLQGHLIAHCMLYGCLALMTVCGGILAPLMWELSDATTATAKAEQALVMIYVHERLWWLVALCMSVVALAALRFSHRIAGPMVRHKRNLRLLAQGKFASPLRTRRHDYMKEEVHCLNEAIAGVAHRVDAILDAKAAILREVEAVMARTPRQSLAGLEKLREACNRLEGGLAAFERVEVNDELPLENRVDQPRLALAGAPSEAGQ
jgi:hypothetical protein